MPALHTRVRWIGMRKSSISELSDNFGRSQAQLRGLMAEVEAGARKEAGKEAGSRSVIVPDTRASAEDGSLAGNWPYLAF